MTTPVRAGDSQDRWIAAALAAGVLVRLWQYLGNPSLWIDELAVARNVLERPVSSLVATPLDFGQVAPPGFLLAVKAVVGLFGNGEYALRLVPLLGALLALPLFLALARRVVPTSAVPLTLWLFALAPPLFRRGADIHPYSTDVTVAIALAILALRWLAQPDLRRGLALGLAAAVAVWFSGSALLVMAGILPALALGARGTDRRAALRSLIPGGLLAGVSMLGAFLVARASLTPEVRSFMHAYWYPWFVPWDVGQAIRWTFQQLPDPLRREYGLPFAAAAAYTVLPMLGWLRLWRRNRAVALVIGSPVVVTLAAAAAQQYPFAHRLVVFLLPFLLLGLGEAIDGLGSAAARWQQHARGVVVGILMLPAFGALVILHPVLRLEEARPVWEHIAAAREPGEPVYVYFTGWLAAGYYAPRAGVPERDVHYGRCHAGEPAGYLAELGALAGSGRVWLFFTHALTPDRVAILGYLDSTATRLDSLVIPAQPRRTEPSASAYRYDLNGRAPRPGVMPGRARPSVCEGPGPHLPVDSALGSWGRR
jgi:hypothetical protein